MSQLDVIRALKLIDSGKFVTSREVLKLMDEKINLQSVEKSLRRLARYGIVERYISPKDVHTYIYRLRKNSNWSL